MCGTETEKTGIDLMGLEPNTDRLEIQQTTHWARNLDICVNMKFRWIWNIHCFSNPVKTFKNKQRFPFM